MMRTRKKTSITSACGTQLSSGRLSPIFPTLGATWLALEPRIMFDGAAAATVDSVADQQFTHSQVESLVSPDDLTTSYTPPSAPTGEPQFSSNDQALFDALAVYDASAARQEIVFLSPSVRDYQKLLDGISMNVEVVVLDPTRDGVEQMAEVLAGRTGVDAIHLITKGTEAELNLGTSVLTQNSLSTIYAEQFQQIGRSLSADADVLIYGCNFGRGDAGQLASNTLAKLTGADVAASTDLTGHYTLGGNWQLERQTGQIETEVVVNETVREQWHDILPIYTQFTNFSSFLEIKSDANHGQTFTYTSGSGTYTVNQISFALYKESGASAQTITMQLRDSWNGAILGTATLSSSTLTTSAAWYDLTFPDITLNDGQSYTIRVLSNTTSGEVHLGFNSSGGYAGGNRIDSNGTPLPGEDVAFKVGYGAQAVGATSIWLSTTGDVSGSGVTGLNAWGKGEVIQFGAPDFQLEPTNPMTDGTLASVFNLANFSSGVNIDAIEYVTRAITIGTGGSILNLQAGDVLLSTDGSATLTSTNTLSVTRDEVFLFRPTVAGVYTSGTFTMVLDNFGSIHGGGDTWSLTFVEHATTVGDYLLSAGSFLFSRQGGAEHGDIRLFTPTGVGAGATAGTVQVLVEGSNAGIGISTKIFGLELIETAMTIGGVNLASGTILMSVDASDTVGSNNLAVTAYDVFRVNFTTTTLGSGSASTTAAMLLDGSDVGLSAGAEKLDALSLFFVVNTAPTLDVTSSPALSSLNEDASAPSGAVGTLVSQLVDFASPSGQVDNVTDLDGTSLGIAVTAADVTNGTWWYSTNGGTNWTALGAVANNSARLLAADANTRLYFQPNADFSGTISSAITFRAWDQSSGTNGVTTDTSTNGGSTAFSTTTDSASLTVTAVNDAPTITNLSGDSLNYSEGAVAVVIEQSGNATVSDVDSANFDTGTLTVSFTAGSDSAEDVLNIRNQGTGAGQIGVSGSSVTYGGVTIGTFTGGSGGSNLLITLNSSATPTAVTALVKNITYENTDTAAPTTGARTVRFVLTDGDGGTSANYNTTVTVSGINDAPTNSVPGAQTVAEDGALIFSAGNGTLISVSDVDTASGVVAVTLTAANGTLTLNGTTGLSFITGDGTGDGTMVFLGTVVDVNQALDGMSFTPILNYNGPASVQITTNDQGNTGSGGPQSDTDTVAITVTSVNDPPVNSIPGPQGIPQNGTLIFSAGNGTLISVSDVDTASGVVAVTLTAANGTLTLNGTTGLSFITGDGTGDGTMVFLGTVIDVNQALDGMSFTPTFNYNGPASVQITTNDQGNTGSGGPQSDTDTVSISVSTNIPPVVTMSGGSLSYTENNGAVAIDTGLTAIDVDNATLAGATVRTTGNYVNGEDLLAFADQLGIIGNWNAATGELTLTGSATVSDYQTALRSITYTNLSDAPSTTTRTVSFAINDGNADSAIATRTITVAAVNDSPTITNLAGDSLAYNEGDGAVMIEQGGNAAVADVDSADFNTGTLTVSFTAGSDSAEDVLSIRNQGTGAGQIGVSGSSLTYGGVTIGAFTGGSGGSNLVITLNSSATSTAVTALTQNITYENTDSNAPTTGARTVRYVLADGDGGTSASYDTTVTVSGGNDPPVNTVPGAQTVNEDTALNLAGISVNDVDGNLSTVQLAVTNGIVTVTLQGAATVSAGANGSATLTLSGTQADINATLATLSYQGTLNYNGADTLTVTSTDSNSVTDVDTVAIAVTAQNDAPVNTVPVGQTVNEDTVLAISGVSVTDVDGDLSTVQLSVTNGTLMVSVAGGATMSTGANGTNTITLSGTQAQINAALATLVYQGTPDYTGADTLTVTSTDSNSVTDNDTIAITVNPVNDAPAIGGIADQTIPENGATTALPFTVTDVETAAGSLTVTATSSNTTLIPDGNLTLVNLGSGNWTITAVPAPNQNGGPVTITVAVSDGTTTTYGTFDVTVTANVPPTITSNSGGATAAVSIGENQVVADTVTSTDVDGGLPTYSIIGGADAALFTIDATTGVLTFNSSPDYEIPGDSGANNVYDVTIQVADGNGGIDVQALSIAVVDVVEGVAPSTPPIVIPPSLVPQSPAPPTSNPAPVSSSPSTLGDDSPLSPSVNGETSVVVPSALNLSVNTASSTSELSGGITEDGKETPQPADSHLRIAREESIPLMSPRADEEIRTLFREQAFKEEPPPLSEAFRRALSFVEEDLRHSRDISEKHQQFLIRTTSIGGITLTAGVITWLLRSGLLLGSLVATMPAWRHFDPLPVVLVSDRKRRKSNADMAAAADNENKQFRGLKHLLDKKGDDR